MIEYDNVEYANSRLSETVVRRKSDGELIYINRVRSLTQVEGYVVGDESNNTNERLSDLDLMPLPLGYTNTVYGSFFITRLPCRRFKQGTNWSNLRLVGSMSRPNRSSYVLLKQPVQNIYPSIDEAICICEDFAKSAAISRNFSLTYRGELFYRGHIKEPVGTVNMDNGLISLSPDKSYLLDVFNLEVT